MADDASLIAQVGRTVGLWGDLKFHIHTDFPEQFKIGSSHHSNRGLLTIADINLKRGTIRFVGYESVDSAKKLTNAKLFANEEQTKKSCQLDEGEYFWFDMIGCVLIQDDMHIGTIKDIQRMGDTDYLEIATDTLLVEEGLAKHFLLPYIERYILKVEIEEKKVYSQDAKDILEAS